jgi:hypothetical protein
MTSRNTRWPSAYCQWYAYHRLKTTAVYIVVFRLETPESSRFKLAHISIAFLPRNTTSRKVAGSIPDGVIRNFHWQSFRPYYDPGVKSVPDRNEYHEYFLGLKSTCT